MNELETFVVIKYGEISIIDLRKIPSEVRQKWIWRCLAEVESIAAQSESTNKCFQYAKKIKNDFSEEKFNELFNLYKKFGGSGNPDVAANAAFWAIKGLWDTTELYEPFSMQRILKIMGDARKHIYKKWLIEELCIYEGQE